MQRQQLPVLPRQPIPQARDQTEDHAEEEEAADQDDQVHQHPALPAVEKRHQVVAGELDKDEDDDQGRQEHPLQAAQFHG
jgi:hypothetical protein